MYNIIKKLLSPLGGAGGGSSLLPLCINNIGAYFANR